MKQANFITNRDSGKYKSSLLASSIVLILAAQCQGGINTTAVVSNPGVTSSAAGSGGFILAGGRNWIADAALGLCRMDPGGGRFTLSNCVRPPTNKAGVTAIIGQPAFDPLTQFVYLPDQSTGSMGIWRYAFNGNTFGAVGVNIAPALGAQHPGAVVFGTDGNLYATMSTTSSIVRVNTPAAATQTVDNMSTTISGQPAHGLAQVGTQLWIVDRDGILDIVDPVGCGTKCRGALMTQILGLSSPWSIAWDSINSYVYIGTPSGVVRVARITGVTDTYSSSSNSGVLFSNITAVGLDGAGNLLLVDDPTVGQVPNGGTVYSVPFFVPGLNPPVQTPPDGQGATPQPPITGLPTIFPNPIANPAVFYSTGLTTPLGAVFMGTHLWVVDSALGFCKVNPALPAPSLTACAVLPAGFVPGAPAYDPLGHFAYLPDTTTGVAGQGILRFPFSTATETLGISPVTVATAAKLAAAVPPAVLAAAKGGATAPAALVYGPDQSLYAAMVAVPNILRITTPSSTAHVVTQIGSMFESSASIAFHDRVDALGIHHDLYDTETTNSSTIFDATTCKGACQSLFLAAILNLPKGIASDTNYVYLGATCPADAPTACTGGIVWRYDPVADTITRLADLGVQNNVLTPFSAISALAVDNLGVVWVVDQTSVWKVDSTALPTITSLAPNQAPESSSPTVTINGTGFLPALVVSTCAAIVPSNVTFVSPTQITATFAINPAGPLGACNVSVTTNGLTTAASAASSFKVLVGPPALTSMNPTSGFRGHAAFPVSIVGANLLSGTLNAIPGITFTGTTVTDTLITTTFTISSTATLGARSITVTTPSGTSNALTFTVATAPPVLTSIAPISSAAAKTVLVTLTGTDLLDATAINTGDLGITVTGLTIVSPTQVTASLTIAATVAAGPRSISITTPGGTSNTVTFTVLPGLTSITPNTARAGSTPFTVTLAGTSLAGVTTVTAPNIAVSAVVATANSVTATFTIAAAAPVGPVNVTVTDVNGTSNAVTFTITGPVPVITSINPITGGTGATVPVTITGTGLTLGTLNLPAGVTIVPGTLVNNSFTTITASLLIAGNAPLGAQTISVTTPGVGNTSNAVTFTVFALAPLLNTISPTTAAAGSTVTVTLTGQGFTGTTSVNTLTGGGITVSSFTVNSGAQITATFQIALNAITQGISVTNPSGTSNPVTFGIVPTLTSINPTSGIAGTTVPVTLTGTSFIGTTAVNITGTGISVTGLTIVSSTQITANFVITAVATQGNHSISVTTPGGTTAQAVTFNVLPPAPVITSLNNNSTSKASRSVGMNVNGTNLGNLPISSFQILLNGALINPTFVTITNFAPSQTQIRFNWTFNAPAPISGAGNVYTLTVTTPSGTSNAFPFTVTN